MAGKVEYNYDETGKWHDFDITGTVKKIIANELPNYGFLLMAVGAEDILIYESSESDNTDTRPKMQITLEETGTKNPLKEKNYPLFSIRKCNNFLEISSPIKQKGTLEIINMKGEKLFSLDVYDKPVKVDISNISSGLYIIKISGTKGIIQDKFFIKK